MISNIYETAKMYQALFYQVLSAMHVNSLLL